MATSKLHIVDSNEENIDGVAYTPDKRKVGVAWQNEAPVGHYITVQLDNHWIITDDEYKLLNKLKKDAKIETTN
jgi:hypothetical protein